MTAGFCYWHGDAAAARVAAAAAAASAITAFDDITTGGNTVTYPAGTIAGYRAAPGWDPVTGWGSPDAQVLVPLLAQEPA